MSLSYFFNVLHCNSSISYTLRCTRNVCTCFTNCDLFTFRFFLWHLLCIYIELEYCAKKATSISKSFPYFSVCRASLTSWRSFFQLNSIGSHGCVRQSDSNFSYGFSHTFLFSEETLTPLIARNRDKCIKNPILRHIRHTSQEIRTFKPHKKSQIPIFEYLNKNSLNYCFRILPGSAN